MLTDQTKAKVMGIITAYVAKNEEFTAFDVTKILRKNGEDCFHNEIKDFVHEYMETIVAYKGEMYSSLEGWDAIKYSKCINNVSNDAGFDDDEFSDDTLDHIVNSAFKLPSNEINDTTTDDELILDDDGNVIGIEIDDTTTDDVIDSDDNIGVIKKLQDDCSKVGTVQFWIKYDDKYDIPAKIQMFKELMKKEPGLEPTAVKLTLNI